MNPLKGNSILFSNISAPKELKNQVKPVSKCTQNELNQLITLSFEYLKSHEIRKRDYQDLKLTSNLTEHEFDNLFNGLIAILKHAIRCPNHGFKDELINEYKFSEEAANAVAIKVDEEMVNLNKKLQLNRLSLPRCEFMKWRICVIISNDVASKIFEPLIMFEIQTNKKRKIAFNCQLNQFHKLRFSVVSCLKELMQIEEKNIIKNK